MTIEELQAKIDHIYSLEPGWDSYDAPRVSIHAVQAATEFILNGLGEESELPESVMPTIRGGIVFFWRDEMIEYMIHPDGRGYFSVYPE